MQLKRKEHIKQKTRRIQRLEKSIPHYNYINYTTTVNEQKSSANRTMTQTMNISI